MSNKKETNYTTKYRNGTITFYINGQVVFVRKCRGVLRRNQYIDRFRLMYPPKEGQERSFIISPEE